MAPGKQGGGEPTRKYDILDVEQENVIAEGDLDSNVVSLVTENAKLREQVEAMKSRPPQTPEDTVRRENEKLQARIIEMENMDRSRAQMAIEIANLKESLSAANDSAKQHGPDDIRRLVKDFTMTTQADLEKEVVADSLHHGGGAAEVVGDVPLGSHRAIPERNHALAGDRNEARAGERQQPALRGLSERRYP